MSEQIVASEGEAAPVETVVQAETPPNGEQLVGNEAPQQAAPESGEQRPKGNPFGERIRELTSDRNYWRDLALKNQQQPQRQEHTPRPTAAEPLKTLKDFNYNEAAFLQYSIQHASAEAAKAAEAKLAKDREEETARSRHEAWEERFDKFAEEHPEIHDGWDTTPITKAMGEALEGSELGPAIGLYLKNNKAVAKELSKMHPFDAAREIGRLEERLAIERKKASEKPVSQAPPPTPRVDAKTASERISTTSPDSDKLSDEEWFKAETARLKRKAARKSD